MTRITLEWLCLVARDPYWWFRQLNGFWLITQFQEQIPMEHIDMKNSLDSKLQVYSICSIRVNFSNLVIFGISVAAQFQLIFMIFLAGLCLRMPQRWMKSKPMSLLMILQVIQVRNRFCQWILKSKTESSESDDNKAQMFVLKAGDKRGVVKKVKSPSRSK